MNLTSQIELQAYGTPEGVSKGWDTRGRGRTQQMKTGVHPRVAQALESTLPDIGQLSKEEKSALDKAVKEGTLIKGKGGPYPAVKTVYAKPGYDFAGEREKWITQMMSYPDPPYKK